MQNHKSRKAARNCGVHHVFPTAPALRVNAKKTSDMLVSSQNAIARFLD
jgi:hypothetical protein